MSEKVPPRLVSILFAWWTGTNDDVPETNYAATNYVGACNAKTNRVLCKQNVCPSYSSLPMQSLYISSTNGVII